MLERIREGAQGPWAMAVIALIVLSFVFAGVGSYLTSSAPTAVATVNGEEIAASELERAYQNQRAQMEQQFGEGVAALFSDPAYLEQFRTQILNRLVGDILLKQHADELGLRVSDEQVREAIVAMPEFQVAGQFNNDRYLALIRQAGFQASDFRDYMRKEMTREQLSRAITGSAFSLDKASRQFALLEQQTRDAQVLNITAELFADGVDVSDEEVQVYYDGNLTQFDTEERVDIAYVALSVSDLETDITLEETAALEYYDSNLAAYGTDEERRVAHILVEFGDEKDAARERIEALQSRLQNGEDFAELAQAESDDTFSAENGGDLGFITTDMMGEVFDEAAFSLAEEGSVSDIVETEFGFHLIQATEIKPAQVASFESVQADIIADLKREEALTQFYEIQAQMTQLAFEVPESLDEVANVANTDIKTTGLVTRAQAPSPINSPAVVAQAFSSNLIEDRVNSDLIEIDAENIIVIRVAEHEPQRTKALDEVKDEIIATLSAQKAQEAAQLWADTLVASIANGDDVSTTLAEKDLAWREVNTASRSSADLGREMSEALFKLAPEENKNTEVVSLANGDVGVVKLTAVNTAESVSDDTVQQFKQRLSAMHSQTTLTNYIESLRENADVVILL